ncbi:hypothetical protein [Enterococcus phage vB_Efs19_KEN17]
MKLFNKLLFLSLKTIIQHSQKSVKRFCRRTFMDYVFVRLL